MKKLHLIMPMGGRGYRFFKDGYSMPKPLIELNGKPFFYWSAQSVMKFVDVANISFVVLQEHIDQFEIDEKIKEYYPQARIVVIPEVLPGAVMTCLEGVKGLDDGAPLLFNDCDHVLLNVRRAAHRADKLPVLLHFPVKDIGRGVEILPRPGRYFMLMHLLVRRRVYREALHQCAAAPQRVKIDVPMHILKSAALLMQLY